MNSKTPNIRAILKRMPRRTNRAVYIVVTLLCAYSSPARGDGVLCQSNSYAGWYWQSDAYKITTDGSLVCIAPYGSVVVILDASDPVNIQQLSTINLWSGVDNYFWDIQIHGSVLFVSHTAYIDVSFFYAFDISDPEHPALLSERFYQSIGEFAVQANFVYLQANSTIEVIDFSDPTLPILVSSIESSGGSGIAVLGDELFTQVVVDSDPELTIFDISNPQNPTLKGSLELSEPVHSIQVDETHIFAGGIFTIQIFDHSDSIDPQLVSQISSTSYAQRYAFKGDQLVATQVYNGMNLYDVSDRANPTLVSTFDTPGLATDIFLANQFAYVADSHTGFQIIDISKPHSSSTLGQYQDPYDNIGSVSVEGGISCVVDPQEGLITLDVSDPANPTTLGLLPHVPGSPNPRMVMHFGATAYYIYNSALNVVDISDLSSPVVLGSIDTSGFIRAMEVKEPFVYLSTSSEDSIQVFDCSDKYNPQLVATLASDDPITSIHIQHQTLYTSAGSTGVSAIDITDPSKPIEIGAYFNPAHYTYTVRVNPQHIAYIPKYINPQTDQLDLVDFSDPSNPVLISTFPLVDAARTMRWHNDRLYLSVDSTANIILDVSNPMYPEFLGWSQWYSDDFEIVGDIGYFATGYAAGLQILDMSDCPPCPADLNNDTALDFFDVSIFLAAFSANDPLADFQQDGSFDFFDVSAFLVAFSAGCP